MISRAAVPTADRRRQWAVTERASDIHFTLALKRTDFRLYKNKDKKYSEM